MNIQNFDNLDYTLRLIFRQIVTEKKINPINFFFQSQDLQQFLNQYEIINRQYCDDLIFKFSPDQFTNLDIDRFKILMNNLFNSYFPFMEQLNYSSDGFLLPDQQVMYNIVLEVLLYQFDIGKTNKYVTFRYVDEHTQKFAIEYFYEKEDIEKAKFNFENQYIELEQLVKQDLDANFQLKIFAEKFSKLASIFCLAKSPYHFFKLSELACVVFQNFMLKYLNLLSQMFNVNQKDKNFKNIFNCIMIFFHLFKYKVNYQFYEKIIAGLNLSSDYLKSIIFNFNQRFLQVLNDGVFFKENFEFLLHIANTIENIPDFNSQIVNSQFLQSIEYFITNKSDKQVIKLLCGFLSYMDYNLIDQNFHFRIFQILEKLNLETEDDMIYRDSLIGIKKCFRLTRNNGLVKIFDKLFEQYKKEKCQYEILSLILSLKNSNTNMFFMIVNSPQFKEITDLFFQEQYPDLILLQILNSIIFIKPQLIIDDEFASNYLIFLQKNFLNEEITFEFLFLKNVINQYQNFILLIIKNNLFRQILKFVQYFDDLIHKIKVQDKNFYQHIFTADYYYYLITEILHSLITQQFQNNFFSYFIRDEITNDFLDQLENFIEYSVNQKQRLSFLKQFYIEEKFVPEDKINFLILEILSEYRDTHVRDNKEFGIMCRLYCLQKFEKFNTIHPSHSNIFYKYDDYYFYFTIAEDRTDKNIKYLKIEDQDNFLIALKHELLNLYSQYSSFEIHCTIDYNTFFLLNCPEDFYKLAVQQLCTIESNDGKIQMGLLLTNIVDKATQCSKCGKMDYVEELNFVNDTVYCKTCMKALQFKSTVFSKF